MLISFNRLFSSGNKSDKQSVEQFNKSEVIQLPVEKIIPNQFQPRTIFEDEKIDELAQTLKTHGIIQPIVVRQLEDEEQYEVIAGERRLRAAKVLEWETISSIIRNLTDTEDRKSTRLNSSHVAISYAVFCLKKKKNQIYHRLT